MENDSFFFIWRYKWNIEMVESLENLGLLINDSTEIVKHEVKKEGRFLGPMMTPVAAFYISTRATSWIQPVASSLINFKRKKVEFYSYWDYLDNKCYSEWSCKSSNRLYMLYNRLIYAIHNRLYIPWITWVKICSYNLSFKQYQNH